MIRVGTDIVEISRFSNMSKRDNFKNRFFSKREVEYFNTLGNPWQSVAGAFAAKEAFSKYLGSGFRKIDFRDIEVLHNELGKPYLEFFGAKIDVDVSISHSKEYAIAVVCGEDGMISDRDVDALKEYAELLPKRHENMHKGDCGRILLIAGSTGYVGAACLCANACIRCGSGLVTLATPQCVQPYASVKLTEVMTYPLDCENGIITKNAIPHIIDKMKNSDACAVGPGLGKSKDLKLVIKEILKYGIPCVIDADGLNIIASDIDILKNRNCDVVLTPHPGEMARLTNLSVAEVEENREGIASEFAKKYGVTLLLKGHNTVIAGADGKIKINTSGNSGMASGGMGDVLTGVIASFIGQGLSGFDAAILGAYIHGKAGDIAADEIGEFGLIASDVIEKLPYAIKFIQRYNL